MAVFNQSYYGINETSVLFFPIPPEHLTLNNIEGLEWISDACESSPIFQWIEPTDADAYFYQLYNVLSGMSSLLETHYLSGLSAMDGSYVVLQMESALNAGSYAFKLKEYSDGLYSPDWAIAEFSINDIPLGLEHLTVLSTSLEYSTRLSWGKSNLEEPQYMLSVEKKTGGLWNPSFAMTVTESIHGYSEKVVGGETIVFYTLPIVLLKGTYRIRIRVAGLTGCPSEWTSYVQFVVNYFEISAGDIWIQAPLFVPPSGMKFLSGSMLYALTKLKSPTKVRASDILGI